jgi:hypothetical protein
LNFDFFFSNFSRISREKNLFREISQEKYFREKGLARRFKTEPTETVALCFGYPKKPCLRAEGKLSSSVDEQHISTYC